MDQHDVCDELMNRHRDDQLGSSNGQQLLEHRRDPYQSGEEHMSYHDDSHHRRSSNHHHMCSLNDDRSNVDKK